MAGNTKELRVRIKSVTSTLQLTKAMGLVASSKIRRANDAMLKAREYTNSLEKSISVLTSDAESVKSPYMRKGEDNRTRIIVISGDRGLAGGYNANVMRLAKMTSSLVVGSFSASFAALRARTSNIISTTIPKHTNNINGNILLHIFFHN